MLLGERDRQIESAPRFSIWYCLWWMLTPAKKKGVLEEDLDGLLRPSIVMTKTKKRDMQSD